MSKLRSRLAPPEYEIYRPPDDHDSSSVPDLFTLLTACGEAIEPAGNEDLGIARYTVDETATEIRITGLDASDQIVAKVSLRVGQVIVPDVSPDPRAGRTLELELRGTQLPGHTSVGFGRLELPPNPDPEAQELLTDPTVAEHLERWNFTMQQPNPFRDAMRAAVQEVAQNECVANGCTDDGCRSGRYTPPCSNGGGYALSETSMVNTYNYYGYGYNAYEQAVVCANGARVYRMCTKANADTPCGGAGPQGCVPCWPDQSDPAGTYGYAACPVEFDDTWCGDSMCGNAEYGYCLSDCGPLYNGQGCSSYNDCQSGFCYMGVCDSSLGYSGWTCVNNSDCFSELCEEGTCY